MNRQEARDRLLNNKDFSEMPDALRDWILGSPNATLDFAEFFEKGGIIDTSHKVQLPSYVPQNPPKIVVDKYSWTLVRQPGSEHMQRAMFGTLAHEIGHDRYNTAITKFVGGSAADYVQYRADIEARAIFNSYPIFRDLQNHSDFKSSFPFDSIGYLGGFELGQHYKDWHAGKMSDDEAVSRISNKVPDTPYGLSEPLTDQNGDGALTHRDLYLRDYNELIRRQPEMAIAPKSAKSTDLGIIDDFIVALDQGNKEGIRSMREIYFRSDDGRQLLEEAATYSRTKEHEANAYLQSCGLHVGPDGHSIGSLTGRRDPRDWDHPDHALYTAVRRELPLDLPDETAAHVMLQAKQAHILRSRDLQSIEVRDGYAFVNGHHFHHTKVDIAQDPPPMEDTVRQSQQLDQQLAAERAQWMAQQQELARSGPLMSL